MNPDSVIEQYTKRFEKEPHLVVRRDPPSQRVHRAFWEQNLIKIKLVFGYSLERKGGVLVPIFAGWSEHWGPAGYHREDGPAIVKYDHTGEIVLEQFYIHGIKYPFDKYLLRVKDPILKKDLLEKHL